MMTRLLLHFVAALALTIATAGAHAQTYPARPIRIVVPYAAGQGTDVATRYLAEQLGKALGQSVIVENRPGAAGNIGTAYAAKSPPDGYTLLMGTNGTHAANPFLYSDAGFDPAADFEPVILTGILPLAIATRPDNPIDSVPKLVEAARARPDAINAAYTTTTSRAVLELFKQQARAPLFGIAFKGSSQAIGDLLGGQIDYMVDTVASLHAQVGAGRLKALAITSRTSSELLPGVKSIAEQGVTNFELTGWNVLYAPRRTPEPIVRQLASELTKILRQPEARARLLQNGIEPRIASGRELTEFLDAERGKWGQIIKSAGIKAD